MPVGVALERDPSVFDDDLYLLVAGERQLTGSGEAIWHSPQHDHENAKLLGSAWVPAARMPRIEEAWSLYGVD